MNAPFSSSKRSANFSPPSIAWLSYAIIGMLYLGSPSMASAEELPRKAPITRYASLWTNSPFTSRPAITTSDAAPEVNPLEDYALLGVSPSGEGFRVTLINRNDPTERIVIDSTRPNERHDFKILEIDRKPGRPLATTVRMSKGVSVGTVAFESSLLTLTPPPAAAPQPQPNAIPNPNPAEAQTQNPQNPRRQPRPRVVPPPTRSQQPNNAQGASPAASGNRNAIQNARERQRQLRR